MVATVLRFVVFGVFDETAVARSPPFEATELVVGLLFPPAPC